MPSKAAKKTIVARIRVQTRRGAVGCVVAELANKQTSIAALPAFADVRLSALRHRAIEFVSHRCARIVPRVRACDQASASIKREVKKPPLNEHQYAAGEFHQVQQMHE